MFIVQKFINIKNNKIAWLIHLLIIFEFDNKFSIQITYDLYKIIKYILIIIENQGSK